MPSDAWRDYGKTPLGIAPLPLCDLLMEWWDRIAFARNAAGMTQDTLARLINADQSTIAKYETGDREPILTVFISIARATGTTPEWLAFGVGDSPVTRSKAEDA
jgi:transcriptional regulator with XRE-family HTH domain